MEEPIPIYGRQINSHKVSNGCPPNLHDEPIPNPRKHREENQQTKESLLVAGEQREAWVQPSQMG